MLRVVGRVDVEPLLKTLCILLGSPPHEAGNRDRFWQISGTTVTFGIESERNTGDPVLRLMVQGKSAINFRMRQGDADGDAAATFARDEQNRYWLLHKGMMTLSTKKTSPVKRPPAGFLESTGMERTDLEIGGKIRRWYPIACLDDGDCVSAIVGFAEYCRQLRVDSNGVGVSTSDGQPEERQPSWVPPREGGWKRWIEKAISDALRHKLKEHGLHANTGRIASGLECDLLIKQPRNAIFEIKKGNLPAQYYCAIGQLISYRTFFEIPDAMLVAVLENDSSTDFRPALQTLGITLVEFTREGNGSVRFFGLEGLIKSIKKLSDGTDG